MNISNEVRPTNTQPGPAPRVKKIARGLSYLQKAVKTGIVVHAVLSIIEMIIASTMSVVEVHGKYGRRTSVAELRAAQHVVYMLFFMGVALVAATPNKNVIRHLVIAVAALLAG